jgi:hypothetical protein
MGQWFFQMVGNLWGRGKKREILTGIFLLFISLLHARANGSPDSVPQGKKVRFRNEFDYSFSLTGSLYYQWYHDHNSGNILLLQNGSYKFSISSDSVFKFSGTFTHNLGFQSYFDSITKVQTDDNTLFTMFGIRMNRHLCFTLTSNLATQLFNRYDYSPVAGGTLSRTLNSSFCTPLLGTFSGGLTLAWTSFGSLSLGISSGKFTYIRDKSIFGKQKTVQFYGVPEGKNHLFEYGLSLQLLVDKKFSGRVKWNCDLLVFKNYNAPVDVTLKNNFGFRINSFLKAGIQTRILYEEMVSRSIQFENLVTFGVYFHL